MRKEKGIANIILGGKERIYWARQIVNEMHQVTKVKDSKSPWGEETSTRKEKTIELQDMSFTYQGQRRTVSGCTREINGGKILGPAVLLSGRSRMSREQTRGGCYIEHNDERKHRETLRSQHRREGLLL